MKEKNNLSAPAVGGSSLLVIFGVLMLSVLALLSLGTVQAESRLSEKSAAAAEAYYGADERAEEIFARLRAGEPVPGVTENDGLYIYRCPISENQTLEVVLEQEGEGWQVLRWQTVTERQLPQETIPLWEGGPQWTG